MNSDIKNEDVALDTARLLRSLVELIVDHPADLTVDYRLMHGRTDFRVLPNINDQGKVVGKKGAHVKALKFLLSRLGEACGQQFVLQLDEDTDGRREADRGKPVALDTYDFRPHLEVLMELLEALTSEQIEVNVGVIPGEEYVFQVAAVGQTYNALLDQRHAGEFDGQSLVTALGTILRAAGLRDGVDMRIEVPPR